MLRCGSPATGDEERKENLARLSPLSHKHFNMFCALEFIRRFSLHILPPGLVRIRHYGILGNNCRKRAIEAARAIFKRRGHAVELQPQSVAFPIPWGTSGVGFVQQSSKSPQSSSICNHTLPRGDLLDSRFSTNVGPFSFNVSREGFLFSINLGRKRRCF